LATNDIFKTANSFKNKTLILPIPANYYADLRSKSLVSEQILQQMQASNVLFDKNDDGDFFHFYCKELNGLFIEIVQRKGSYNRFGEINAQIRLAAQERDRKIKT
jgi:4-hydroxyphenylpyruvate dioxygenase